LEIWQGDAYCPSEPHWQLKFRVFKNPRWRTAVILKIEKSRFKSKCLVDLHEIWHGSAPLNHIGSQNFDLKNPIWQTAAILKIGKSPASLPKL